MTATKHTNLQRRTAWVAALLVGALLIGSLPTVMAADTGATTTNATPTISNVYLYTSDPSASAGATCPAGAAASFDPVGGTTRTVYVCVEASDDNGYNDVCDSSAQSANEVHTYTVMTSADAALPSRSDLALTCATGSGAAVALTGSFTMEHWRAPGLAASSSAYKIATTITDVEAATAADPGKSFDYTALTHITDTTSGTLNFGATLAPGALGAEQAATVRNTGNQAFTVQVAGSALTGATYGNALAVGNVKWATTAGADYDAGMTALTGSAASTSQSAAVESGTPTDVSLYLSLKMPGASSGWVPKDSYSGTVTLSTG